MSHSTASVGSSGQTNEVMAAIDTDGHATRLVIADVSTDGTWLSIPVTAAASLIEWR